MMSTPTSTLRAELGALGPHLGQAAVEDRLLHLELGDAVAQQAADAIGPLEDHHPVAGPGQLLGGGQAGRARADDRHRPAGEPRRADRGTTQPSAHAVVDDRDLDLLDGDRSAVDPEHAGRLARRGAEPPGELGEVVGGVQALDGVVPAVPVHQVVPVRDDVARAGSRCCRTGCRSPCTGWPGPAARPRGSPRRPRSSRAAARAPDGARACARSCFRNPLASPIVAPQLWAAAMIVSVTSRPSRLGQARWPRAPAVVVGHHLAEAPRRSSSQSPSSCVGDRSSRSPRGARRRSCAGTRRSVVVELLEVTISKFTRDGNVAVRVEDVGDAAGHAGAEVAAGRRRAPRPRPPVMYSHPWSPTPSTTAVAPELRTQNRSPTTPRRNTSPPVAP